MLQNRHHQTSTAELNQIWHSRLSWNRQSDGRRDWRTLLLTQKRRRIWTKDLVRISSFESGDTTDDPFLHLLQMLIVESFAAFRRGRCSNQSRQQKHNAIHGRCWQIKRELTEKPVKKLRGIGFYTERNRWKGETTKKDNENLSAIVICTWCFSTIYFNCHEFLHAIKRQNSSSSTLWGFWPKECQSNQSLTKVSKCCVRSGEEKVNQCLGGIGSLVFGSRTIHRPHKLQSPKHLQHN